MVEDIRKVGFIGLGSMGGDQARQLAKLPLELTVYDISPAARAAFEGKATIATEIAGVARDADVVSICVQDDKQANQCCDAVLPVMKPGSILMVHSTVRPQTMVAIGERAAAYGVEVLDASVSRTNMSKDGPFVFCMTGGKEDVADRVKGVLDAFSTDTMHVGQLGSAMALKICNNLASWCAIMIGLEAVEVAEAAGVPLDKLLTVMTRNGVLSMPAQSFVAFRSNPGEEARRAVMRVQAGIGEKDLTLAQELAEGAHAPAPITEHVRGLVRSKILEICDRQV